MPDFESGAFNRALPPLRNLSYAISAIYSTTLVRFLACEIAGVRFGVPSVFAPDHLQGSVTEQLGDGAQVDPGHNQSTGKSMAAAMPRVAVNLCFVNCCRKPATRSLKSITAAGEGK